VIPGKQYTPELVLATAWRRKWLILIPTVLIGTVASAVTYTIPDQYQSATTILVTPPRVPENYVKSTVTMRVEDRLRSINAQVRSRTRLEQVIEEFDLYADRRQTDIMQDIVDDMSGSINVDFVESDVFRVSFTAGDPRTAMNVANKLATFFIDDSLRDRSQMAEGTSRFLESELVEAERKLRETEQQLAEYRRRHDGELPTQIDANMQGISNARMEMQSLRSTLEQAREKELALTRQVNGLSEALANAPAPAPVEPDTQSPRSAAAQLQIARTALQNMLLKMRPDHPDVRRAEDLVADLERKAELEAAQVPLTPQANPVDRRVKELEDAQVELGRVRRAIDAYIAQQRDLDARIGQYQRRLEAAPARESELVDLLRNYSTLSTAYEQLYAKRLDSQVSANLEHQQIGETFKVLDPARLPEKPSSPDRPRQYALGILMAIAIGLTCAGTAEYLDRGLHSEDDVRLALALPVVATIPVINPKQMPKKSRRLLARFASAVVLTAVAAGAIWYTRG
jgi:polysaccharide chain length determinant protein (PEP-CTERM system associated)